MPSSPERTDHTPKPPRRLSGKLVTLLAQAVVSLVLLRYALTDANVGASLRHLASLPLHFILLAFGITVVLQFLVVARWWVVLGVLRSRLPYWTLVKITFVGFLFNNFMPALVGQDAVRIYYLGRRSSFLGAGVSVVFDKILGLLVLASFSTLPLFLGADAGAGPLNAGRICLGVVALLCCGLLALQAPVEKVLRWALGRRPWAARILDALLTLVSGFRACITPGVFLAAYAVGFLILAGTTCIYMEYARLTGAVLPGFWQLFGAVSVIMLLSNLPISFNGIGVREKAHLIFLGALGLSCEQALGISILQYAFLLGLGCIGMALWLRLRHPRHPQGAEQPAAPARD